MTSTSDLRSQTSDSRVAHMAYILSASYSGSTLLAMLLGTHPQACTVGEIRAPSMGEVELYQCSCGQKIKQCSFWAKISEAMSRKGIAGFDITNAATSIYEVPDPYSQRLLAPLQRGPVLELARDCALSLSPAWRRYLAEVRRRNLALVEALQGLTAAKMVVDSSKSVLHLKYLLKIPALEIKVIRLIRDGRAVALSIIGHGLQRPTREQTVAAAAREWRRSNEAAECLLRRLPASQWLGIQYEELCRKPEATLRRICQSLGLDPEVVNLDFRSREQHILGNEMRLKSTSQIQLDERWRTQLAVDDLRVFDAVAGTLNLQYGYK